MRLYKILALGCFTLSAAVSAQKTLPHLQKKGTATQLIVNQKPFLVLGGELGNSSASSFQDIERDFPKLQKMELNTVLVPAKDVYVSIGEFANVKITSAEDFDLYGELV